MYDGEVAPPVVTVIMVPLGAQGLDRQPGQEEAQGKPRPLGLLIPQVEAKAVEH